MATYRGDLSATNGNDIVYGVAVDIGPNPAPGNPLIGSLNNQIGTLYGYDGNDIIFGDLWTANPATDTEAQDIYGGDGNDWIFGDYVDFSYAPLLAAFPGLSHIVFTLEDGTTVDITGNTGFLTDTVGSTDGLHGGAGNDHIFGGGAFDFIYGDAGNDTLHGGAGDDAMEGGSGNDVYYVDHIYDTASEYGGNGIDTVYTTVTYSIDRFVSSNTFLVENLTGQGSSAIALTGNVLANRITGNAASNVITGLAGADTLTGGAGSDSMVGGSGNDVYYVDHAADVVSETGGSGVDTVYTTVSYSINRSVSSNTYLAENINGQGSSGIALTGNVLANHVNGNAASNAINGLSGADTLSGGAGNDYFVFNTSLAGGANRDVITDFNGVYDFIRIENAVFTKVTGAGGLSSAQFYAGTAAHDSSDRIIYNKSTGALSYDADGNKAGGVAAITFAVLSNHATLTYADFLII